MSDQTALFNQIKDRLSAVTESPGMTAFHGGRVHMTLEEWERLVSLIELAHLQQAGIRQRCAAMERGVGYRVSGDHSTWGEYHEGKHDFASEIAELVGEDGETIRVYTADHISTVANQAAEAVLGIPEDDDERLRDAINLVVNATLHFLDHPDDSLQEVAEANYEPDFAAEILESLK